MRMSLMNWTVVRPGYLTDEPSHGLLDIAPNLGKIDTAGTISHEDVAKVIVGCLARYKTFSKTFDIFDGKTPLEEALDSI